MKRTYTVAYQFGPGSMDLLTIRSKEYFTSDNLEEARAVYDAELKELSERCTDIKDLDYDATDEDCAREGIVLSLFSEGRNEAGDLVECDDIANSGYFFDARHML